MRVAVTGASGLLGMAAAEALTQAGHTVTRLVRSRAAAAGEARVYWNPATGEIDAAGLEGHHAVVHLAGESLLGLWTTRRRERIRRSRLDGTRLIAEAAAGLARRPAVLVSASAIGIYGSDRAGETLDERTTAGPGFLAELGVEWEAAAEPARRAGIRVVHPRTGLVLTGRGGLLRPMLLPFRLGLGGRVGSGRQAWSWIALEDWTGALLHALGRDDVSGAVNFTAPRAATNAQFTRTLARVLGRPAPFVLPAAPARLLLGEQADEMLLFDQRVLPQVLLETGYRFRFPDLEPALRAALGKPE